MTFVHEYDTIIDIAIIFECSQSNASVSKKSLIKPLINIDGFGLDLYISILQRP